MVNPSSGNTQKSLIQGAFSAAKHSFIGSGSTKQRVQLNQKDFFLAEEQPDGTMEVQSLNENFVPSGNKCKVEKKEFLEKYAPEPQLYINKVAPAMRELDMIVKKADEHRQESLHFSAEGEYATALKIDENNIRATFGLGLTYLDLGDSTNADMVFRKLSKLSGAFEPKHKHLFNEFGISLRKNKMYIQALKHYARARQLSKNDEHIIYNLARVYFEMGKLKCSSIFLTKALKVNPQFEKGKVLLEHVQSCLGQSPSDNLLPKFELLEEDEV